MIISLPDTYVLAFGTFDPFHDGHRVFLEQAKGLGTFLTVVVARDAYITAMKQRTPFFDEHTRLRQVALVSSVDWVLLGQSTWPTAKPYALLQRLRFDVLALGYDQTPDDEQVRQILAEAGRATVNIVRLPPYEPTRFKSTLLREQRHL